MSRTPAEGFQVVAISPNMPGSPPAGMNGEFSRMTILSSPESTQQLPPTDSANVAFVKGGKRKRLSKACDACHKSKRRCDGTAPCSNCYFASKECTYTDSSGRSVPAPRVSTQERPIQAPGRISAGHSTDSTPSDTNAGAHPETTTMRRQTDQADTISKRVKPEKSLNAPSITSSPSVDSGHSSPTTQLDSRTQLMLINLFFAHCNPHRLILHKTSFLASLTHERVPQSLILAICAIAAPYAKEIANAASMPRLAGVPFFQEAVNLMFDASGRLLSEPTLATAQSLCLLEMHEVAASHSWTKHYRYFDLALQVLEDALEVHKSDSQSFLATLSAIEARQYTIERECTRRCFWLVQSMHWINGIYTYRPMRPRCIELMKIIPLPVDEDSFELGRILETEFLHIPGPRKKTASEFGHVCRALSIYQTLEAVLATTTVQARPPALAACREAVQTWLASLPDHLRFSQENLDKQIDMFETGSTTSAWCYCFIHALHPCYILELTDAEGRLGAEPISWVRDQLDMIFKATGHRAKNTILSACALWTYSKYYPTDPRVEEWDDAFEGLWGFRVTLVAAQWRKTQSEQRSQIGRTYPVDGVSQHDSSPAFAVASSDSSPASPPARLPSPRSQPTSAGPSQPSSTRSSPRDRHADPRTPSPAAVSYAAVSGTSPGRRQPPPHAHHRPLQPQQSLPSLKASGLLDSWPPPTEAYAQSAQVLRPEGMIHSPHDLGRAGNAAAMSWRHDDGQ